MPKAKARRGHIDCVTYSGKVRMGSIRVKSWLKSTPTHTRVKIIFDEVLAFEGDIFKNVIQHAQYKVFLFDALHHSWRGVPY